MSVVVTTSPSLALVKYWGKIPGEPNTPATSSLAVGLGDLTTTTRVEFAGEHDTIVVSGETQPAGPYRPILDHYRELRPDMPPVSITSGNSFPTSAGIASSSSGFAAIAVGLDALLSTDLAPEALSRIARIGSGSAARAVYGGFTILEAGADHAVPYRPASHWPDLAVLIAITAAGRKPVPSRVAMERARTTSPWWARWVELSEPLFVDGCRALDARDLDALGEVMRQSYLAMFATMFTSTPPINYWLPESVALQRLCEQLRSDRVPAWETMDAGPQVKIVTTGEYVESIRTRITDTLPGLSILLSSPGGNPRVERESDA